jgi:tetratricopeptide (TPR) repeat protein
MKKKISFLLTASLLTIHVLMGQSLEDAKSLLRSQYKIKSARETFKKLYEANSKDPQTIYWYGQSYILGESPKEDIQFAKDLYQKALADGVNDPYIWIGIAHTDLLFGGDINAAKQKFEQAITATTETKGKNKGKPNAAILGAIGRANALGRAQDGSSKFGDPTYGIEKLKVAESIDPTNTDNYIVEGILNLKMGGENGGEAVKAFQEALNKDPKNALALNRLGRVYASQNNPDVFLKYFEDAIVASPTYPDSYLSLFEYYKYKDVNKAKEYLDKFIANADKDPRNELFLADYLFQSGKYKESLAKAKEIEAAANITTVPRINMLYALDYDRLGDSIQSKAYLEKFFTTAPADKIMPQDYDLAVKVFSKFPGSELIAVTYLEKATANDPVKANQLNYANQAADLLGKGKLYTEQVKWLQKAADLKGGWGEIDYYKITNATYLSKDYNQTIAVSDKYIAAFPEKPQGYTFKVKAAKALDTTTTPGIAVDAINQQNTYLMKDSEKNKKEIFRNLYYQVVYFGEKAKDYPKGIEVCDKMLALFPNTGEENDFAVKTKETLIKASTAPSKQTKPGSVQPGKSPK